MSKNDLLSSALLDIVKNGFKIEKDILFLFSAYISSNPNFKYNITYLTDSIDSFIKNYHLLRSKIEIYKEIVEYIKTINKSTYTIEVKFDDFMTYTINKQETIASNSNGVPNKNDIFSICNPNLFIKLTSIKPRIEYTYELKDFNNDSQFKKEIKEYFKKLKINDK